MLVRLLPPAATACRFWGLGLRGARRDALRRSDGVRAESQRALDGLRGEFEALTRELTAEGGAHASWSAASSILPHGADLGP